MLTYWHVAWEKKMMHIDWVPTHASVRFRSTGTASHSCWPSSCCGSLVRRRRDIITRESVELSASLPRMNRDSRRWWTVVGRTNDATAPAARKARIMGLATIGIRLLIPLSATASAMANRWQEAEHRTNVIGTKHRNSSGAIDPNPTGLVLPRPGNAKNPLSLRWSPGLWPGLKDDHRTRAHLVMVGLHWSCTIA